MIYNLSKKIWFLLFLLLLLNWCSIKQYNNINIQTWTDTDIELSNFNTVSQLAIKSLKEKNMDDLYQIIWADWLIFSPYNNINTWNKKISKEDIKNLFSDIQVINRWDYDWSWEPINLTFKEYFNQFVYDVDFSIAPEKIVNNIIQRWNIINNIKDFYPNSQTIEYYFSWFDSQYEWIDRRSLTLIFNKIWNNRYLIGISHWQRTI
jgi:hypothetical protein